MKDGTSPSRRAVTSILYVAVAIALFALLRVGPPRASNGEMPFSELMSAAGEGRVEAVHIEETQLRVRVRPAASSSVAQPFVVGRLPGVDESDFVAELRGRGVKISGEVRSTGIFQTLFITWVLPLLIGVGFVVWMSRTIGRAGPPPVGKSKPRLYDLTKDPRVTFADVAGVDEAKAELIEIVTFLKDPAKHRALGARPPRGVLLVGPPGTGKTLLARAVAGEAGVAFYSLSGSEFVELFVGVGAARVRDLFKEAKAHAPCIVFIDELDAVGKARSFVGGAIGGHEEREQTLNQLLSEMDGFDVGEGVVILAATNRPEILDRALLRAGRFDRQVVVDRPDLRGREAILRVHVRKLPLAPDVELSVVARRTPGMVGAELANVANEAALSAARRDVQTVEQRDFEVAIDRIQLGLEKQGRVLPQRERRRVAYHEAGHALVALTVRHADPVHKVTIIPRSIGALGATLQLPADERHLLTRSELLDRIGVAMGGRAAEELACDEPSTGAESDLEHASELARQMVRRYGMSERVGPVTYGAMVAPYLDPHLSARPECSEQTAIAIDAEVRSIVQGAARRARTILEERRGALDAIAERLEREETLDRETLLKLIAQAPLPRTNQAAE